MNCLALSLVGSKKAFNKTEFLFVASFASHENHLRFQQSVQSWKVLRDQKLGADFQVRIPFYRVNFLRKNFFPWGLPHMVVQFVPCRPIHRTDLIHLFIYDNNLLADGSVLFQQNQYITTIFRQTEVKCLEKWVFLMSRGASCASRGIEPWVAWVFFSSIQPKIPPTSFIWFNIYSLKWICIKND